MQFLRHTWNERILDLEEVVLEGTEWINLAPDRHNFETAGNLAVSFKFA
jgi:hypothetical protein